MHYRDATLHERHMVVLDGVEGGAGVKYARNRAESAQSRQRRLDFGQLCEQQ